MSSPIPLRLRVRDVLGVATAEVPIEEIMLVGGDNAAGKSSFLQACAAAALSAGIMRGVTKKADTHRTVRRQAESRTGAATLEWAEGSRRISWPGPEIETTGNGDLMVFGSPLAIGAARLMDLSTDKRIAALAERLQTEPTEDDIRDWLMKEKACTEKRAGEIAKEMAKRVATSGWDAVEKTAKERATKVKGAWEEVAREKWGEVKAASWAPDGLLKNEPYVLDTEAEVLVGLQDKLKTLTSSGAATEAQIADARAAASLATVLRQGADTTRSHLANLTATREALRAELDALPKPDGGRAPLACPHCDGALHVTIGADRLPVVTVAPDPLSGEENGARQAAITEKAGAINAISLQIDQAERKLKEDDAKVAVAAAAEDRLAKLEQAERIDPKVLAEAQAAVKTQETKTRAVERLTRANALFTDWQSQQPAIAALAPDGVRNTVLAQKLEGFNLQLSKLSAAAKWPAVKMLPTGDAMFGESAYAEMSESERWRTDLVLMLALAQREGSKLVLVDRVDVLTPDQRPALMVLLRHVGIPALAAMSARDADSMPKLEKAGFGRCAWMEAGTLRMI